ncbi:hypothetical protein K6119_15805 [Paracrocinitomix mangrovi]|uniref:hypothetical protein n=1 Tax=Paracrocinitomix mangrovi TaxID=2862509 RepID=UPI001C8D66B0|nr:hypothetical protein [Paracrocinitomix mangrovi]UKN01195.1 hypothetical protein K6119_15805 [Paracrocinitomix mangrovi]
MKKLNWKRFGVKFDGQEQLAFERLSYALFCSRFNQSFGILAYKNQTAIETDPIEVNGEWFGFQAKFLEPATEFKSYKKKIIESLENAKDKNPEISVIYIYVNKPFSESKKKGVKKPDYIIEIEQKATDLEIRIDWQVPSHFEKQLSLPQNTKILKEFFPELIEKELVNDKTEELLDINRTAIIQVELAKIKAEFSYDWVKSEELLTKLYAYSEFRNERIAQDIFGFLNINVSNGARANMPSSVACTIEGLVFTYFPSSRGKKDKDVRLENGKECLNIGFNMIYDALIHTSNFKVAQWGLSIWKFIYRESKRNKDLELVDAVLDQYKEIERNLDRPERDDLENAKSLIELYKDDLDSFHLSAPYLTPTLIKLMDQSY